MEKTHEVKAGEEKSAQPRRGTTEVTASVGRFKGNLEKSTNSGKENRGHKSDQKRPVEQEKSGKRGSEGQDQKVKVGECRLKGKTISWLI